MDPARDRPSDSEKITINLGFVDLGRIDLMVQDAFYANRSDFIRSAIRRQLEAHAPSLTRALERKTLDLGLRDFDRAELEAVVARSEMLDIRVVGLVRIAADVPAELAVAAIAQVTVLGAFQASPAVKAALRGRIR